MGFPVLWYNIRLSILVGLRWEHSKSIYKNPYIRIISSISKLFLVLKYRYIGFSIGILVLSFHSMRLLVDYKILYKPLYGIT